MAKTRPTIEELSAQAENRMEAARLEGAAFRSAVGTMVLSLSDVEFALYRVVLFYAGLNNSVGRAIISSQRAKTLTGILQAMIVNEVILEPRSSDIKTICEQINSLNTARDMIVHYASGSMTMHDGENNIHVSSAGRKNRKTGDQVFAFSAAVVSAMTHDLQAAAWRLDAHRTSRRRKGPLTKEYVLHIPPWRYTPPLPVPTHLQNRLHFE